MNDSCKVCESRELVPFYEVERQPALSTVLWPSAADALAAPQGRIELCACSRCGFVGNQVFDPELAQYDTSYDNSLHHSPKFRAYAEALARRLVQRYELHGKRIVDIGCGSGEFLRLLCQLGGNEGVGYDMGYSGPERDVQDGVTFHAEAFPPEAARDADLITCQHVLEHIPEPRPFLADLARYAAQRSGSRPLVAYFEVPNGEWILDGALAWDVIYEHCSYFLPSALRRLFEEACFTIADMGTGFEGQYLWIEAVYAPTRAAPALSPADGASACRLAGAFGRRVTEVIARWRAHLTERAEGEGPTVLWGAGAKTITFLNRVDPQRELVNRAVDLNPRKHGKFVTGTGHPIVAPEDLLEARPGGVMLANGCYRAEVSAQCADLGLPAPSGPSLV